MTNDAWSLAKGGIRKDIGAHNYTTWIEPLSFRSMEEGTLSLASPTEFIGKWVMQNFRDVILRHVSANGDSAARLVSVHLRMGIQISAPPDPLSRFLIH